MIIKEIKCKSALNKCGFPGGGLAINPYIGCNHSCLYCYARFIKKFTGHQEKWGTFVDVKTNIVDVLKKEIISDKNKQEKIFIGTVTDPYQLLEKKYKLTRGLLKNLIKCQNEINILTKSNLILRDIDLLKKKENIIVNITINSLDQKWQKLIEPNSSNIKERLITIEKLTEENITVFIMIGPYFPFFTNIELLFKEFKKRGVKHLFIESFNTMGGNWIEVEKVLQKKYSNLCLEIKEIFFNEKKFFEFYNKEKKKIEKLSKKYQIPVTIYFNLGHAGKFK